MTPVVVRRQVLGLSEQKTVEVAQSQCSDKVDDVPVVQVVVGVSLEVPQIQFIARVRGHSSCTETVAFSSVAMKGFFRLFLAIFRAPPVCPGVERQLGSPR